VSESIARVRRQPELIQVNDRQLSTQGWISDLAERHLMAHLTGDRDECTIECMARTMFGRNIPRNREAVRRRISGLHRKLLEAHKFLIIRYSERGQIIGCKFYSSEATEDERIVALTQIERMARRGDLSHERLEIARALLG